MKKIREVLKNNSGQGVPMILAVVLCCLILACVTFEYMRLMIVAQGVRDSVQSAIVDVVTVRSAPGSGKCSAGPVRAGWDYAAQCHRNDHC